MKLSRGNSYTHIDDAPAWFLDRLAPHLSVPVEVGTKTGARFGRIYATADEWRGTLLVGNRIPAGLTPHVLRVVAWCESQGYPIDVRVEDTRIRPPDAYPWYTVRAAWRPYQDAVHAAVMQGECGVVDAPPRSGKTLMAARLIDHRAQPVLYIAPSVAIVSQTHKVLCSIFGDEMVARVDGDTPADQRDVTKPIVVATVQSAVKLPREFYQTRGMLLIDEFHHAAADTYHQINALAESVYYRVAFTGTHWRTGEDGLAMQAIASNVLHTIAVADLVPQYLVTPFVSFVPYHAPSFAAADWQTAYQRGIVDCEERNALIASYACQLSEQGIPTIVIANRRAHADALAARIPESRVAKGGEGILTSRTVKAFLGGEFPVLVGTGVLGEGVDLPNAGALIYASGLGDSVQMMQSYFRPLTAHAGKTHGRVYDFRDAHHPTLQRHARDRFGLASRYLGQWVQK